MQSFGFLDKMLCFSSLLKCFSLCLQDAWKQKDFFSWPVCPASAVPVPSEELKGCHQLFWQIFLYYLRRQKVTSHILCCAGINTQQMVGEILGVNVLRDFVVPAQDVCSITRVLCDCPAVQIVCVPQLHPGRFKYPPVQNMLPPPGSSLPFPALWSFLTAIYRHWHITKFPKLCWEFLGKLMQAGERCELCVAHPERQEGEGQALHKGYVIVRIC